MPIYEYECNDCNNHFEELVSMGFDKPLPCPKCSSEDTKKVMSAFGGIGRSNKGLASCGTSCPSAGGCESGRSCCQFS